MDYAKMTVASPSFVKRLSHCGRFRLGTELLDVSDGDVVLDYGTGNGYMLKMIEALGRKAELYGYEPEPEMYRQLTKDLDGSCIKSVADLASLDGMRFSKVCCCEVLEHLEPDGRRSALKDIHRLLNPDGMALVTVPIESGLSSLLKNIMRLVIGQAHPNTTTRNVVKSVFGMPIERVAKPPRTRYRSAASSAPSRNSRIAGSSCASGVPDTPIASVS